MANLDDVAADVKQLKHEVHAQGNIMKLMMYSQASDFTASVVDSLTADTVLLAIYRGVDGVITKSDLIKSVVDMNLPNGKQASVYAKFSRLEDLGIVEPVAGSGRSVIYRKSAISDGLRIEQNPDYLKALKAAKLIK